MTIVHGENRRIEKNMTIVHGENRRIEKNMTIVYATNEHIKKEQVQITRIRWIDADKRFGRGLRG
jgi:hypothetical protein